MLLGRDADYKGKECVHDGKVTKSPDSKIAHSKSAQNVKLPIFTLSRASIFESHTISVSRFFFVKMRKISLKIREKMRQP